MKKDNDKLAYYLPIMISLGVVFGICFDNIGIGICLGVGAALSLFGVFNFCGGQTFALNIWGSWKQHL